MKLPHPIPYQGSKRNLASSILAVVGARRVRCFYEPFAGSAAITIAAASAGLSQKYVIGDSLEPLTRLWQEILFSPERISGAYADIWNAQHDDHEDYYAKVRSRFNELGAPSDLLFLLVRCVKNSPRWNRAGQFNQSADLRRSGMNPVKMTREINGAHFLLKGKTEVTCGDFEETIARAGSDAGMVRRTGM